MWRPSRSKVNKHAQQTNRVRACWALDASVALAGDNEKIMATVFLSFTVHDRDFSQELRQHLNALGHKVCKRAGWTH